METEPARGVSRFEARRSRCPDETLLFQFGVAAGGNVSLGGPPIFEIAGALRQVRATRFFPRVLRVSRRVFYIALARNLPLDLLRPGSVALTAPM